MSDGSENRPQTKMFWFIFTNNEDERIGYYM